MISETLQPDEKLRLSLKVGVAINNAIVDMPLPESLTEGQQHVARMVMMLASANAQLAARGVICEEGAL